jgi:hypothetical protein
MTVRVRRWLGLAFVGVLALIGLVLLLDTNVGKSGGAGNTTAGEYHSE